MSKHVSMWTQWKHYAYLGPHKYFSYHARMVTQIITCQTCMNIIR